MMMMMMLMMMMLIMASSVAMDYFTDFTNLVSSLLINPGKKLYYKYEIPYYRKLTLHEINANC